MSCLLNKYLGKKSLNLHFENVNQFKEDIIRKNVKKRLMNAFKIKLKYFEKLYLEIKNGINIQI